MDLSLAQVAQVAAWTDREHGPPPDMFAALMAQDAKLVAAGFPPMSPWWKDAMRDFYASGALRFVGRVGRRGGKSTTMDRVMACEVLHGRWTLPPGDMGVFCIFSVKVGFAEDRLRNIEAILMALGVEYAAASDKVGRYIKLPDRPVCWRAFAANFRTAVSFTAIGFMADELARWHDDRTGANPAAHVLQSVRPAMLTQLRYGAKELLISSPWSTLDAHYDAFERGDNANQVCREAATWVANPTLTEADCRRLADEEADAGDNVDFDREYGAIPMTSGEAWFFDHAAVEAAAYDGEAPLPVPGMQVTAGADFGFASDHSAVAVDHRTPVIRMGPNGPLPPNWDEATHVIAARALLKPQMGAPLVPSAVVEQFARLIRKHQVPAMMADAHYAETVREYLNKHSLVYQPAPLEPAAVFVRFRQLLRAGRVKIPRDKQLLRDFKEVRAKPTASGRISIKLPQRPGGGHCDLVSAIVLACWPTVGHTIEAPKEPEVGWTDEETAEVEAFEAQLRAERGDDDEW